MPQITVEFYGIPRERAGCAALTLEADTAGEALAAIQRQKPNLAGIVDDTALAKHYRLSLAGQYFITDLRHPLHAGDRLLLLSADAGG